MRRGMPDRPAVFSIYMPIFINIDAPHCLGQAVPRPALTDEIFLEPVAKPRTVQDAAEIELEILELVFPIVDLAEHVGLVRK